jgi:hypothetical protein
VDSFPLLTLEQVYGAIAYYLAHQTEVDAYLRQGESDFAALRQHLRHQHRRLYDKLAAAKRHRQAAAGEPGSTPS